MFQRVSRRKASRKRHFDTAELQDLPVRATATQQPKANLTPQNILQLQRTVGNQATQRVIHQMGAHRVQRLPSPRMVIAELGEPHKDKKRFGKTIKQSTFYRDVLKALTDYNTIVLNNNASMDDLPNLMNAYDEVQRAASGYVAAKSKKKFGKNDTKLAYMQRLLSEISGERAMAYMAAVKTAKTPNRMIPKWHVAIGNAKNANAPVEINDTDVTGSDKGGSHEVEKVNKGGERGYFKSEVNEVPLLPVMDYFSDSGYRGPIEGTSLEGMDTNALLNAYNVPDYAGIIEPVGRSKEEAQEAKDKWGFVRTEDLHLAKRDVAMSRLNELLGGEVIARAQLAIRKTGDGEEKEGSLMEAANGTQATEAKYGDAPSQDTIDINDPNLQRMLSRLQLIDALAMQVDRNLSNFFIQTDTNGQVLGITGIDNDMAFGQFAETIGRRFNFPGMSKFVDAELARKIIDLDPQDLAWALGDLLSPKEIDSLQKRLAELQDYLKELESKEELLEPDQWDKATAVGMLEEDTSYYAKLRKQFYEKKKK